MFWEMHRSNNWRPDLIGRRVLFGSVTPVACDDPQHIRRFSVSENGQLSGGDVFHVIEPGCSDGLRIDIDGNVWSSAGDGVHCIAPDGRLLGKIRVPELVSNLCFGGRAKHEMYITATTSLYRVSLNRTGIQRP